jgi:hypothetical protein
MSSTTILREYQKLRADLRLFLIGKDLLKYEEDIINILLGTDKSGDFLAVQTKSRPLVVDCEEFDRYRDNG